MGMPPKRKDENMRFRMKCISIMLALMLLLAGCGNRTYRVVAEVIAVDCHGTVIRTEDGSIRTLGAWLNGVTLGSTLYITIEDNGTPNNLDDDTIVEIIAKVELPEV